MTKCFADTAYYLALVNPSDVAHEAALRFTESFRGRFITTSAVINELGNHLRHPVNRQLFVRMAQQLGSDKAVRVVHVTPGILRDAVRLFSRRPDQQWSLTDCISFHVMEQQGLTDALTTDRHFEQAGFTALLKP